MPAVRKKSRQSLHSRVPMCEWMEDRVLMSSAHQVLDGLSLRPTVPVHVPHGHGHDRVVVPPIAHSSFTPFGTPGPTGTLPAQIRHAYNIDQITFNSGAVQGDGTGQTIAIIDAYNDPKMVNSTSSGFVNSDLHKFDVAFGLPDPPSFIKTSASGTLPASNHGWASEIALDVEWAHVIAPGANILLVEAASASDFALNQAEQYALGQPAVSVISMSFGGSEFSGQSSDDSNYYTTPAGHQGITFVASAGDTGGAVGYPATSPNVLAVGGTTLSIDGQGNYLGERGWSDGGGGPSTVEPLPAYQNNVQNNVDGSFSTRMTPDVAFDADPNTGVSIYDTYNNTTSAPWAQYGGTSLSAPCWGGLVAIFDQGRVAAGLGTLDGPSQTLPMLYSMPSDAFHDITTGSNGYAAGAGYDLVTGLGSPVANLMAARFVATPNVVVNGTAGNDSIYTLRHGDYLYEWINVLQPGVGSPTHIDLLQGASSLSIFGGGGSDTITIDESNGDVLQAPTTLSENGLSGSIALRAIGSIASDNVVIDGTAGSFSFNSSRLNFSDVASIFYSDNGGGDIITTSGPIPVTLSLSGGDSITVNSGNVILIF